MHRFLLLLAVLCASPLAAAQAPTPGDLAVNEIQYDPPSGGAANEWVEVYNRSDRSLNLADVAVRDAGATSSPVGRSLVVEPGGFAVLVRDGDAFAAAFPGVAFVEVDRFPALNNTGDTVGLVLGETLLDSVPYERAWGGDDASLERIDTSGPSDQASNWATTTDPAGGTPGARNSAFVQDTDPPEVEEAEATDARTVVVTFSEPLDAATAETASNYRISGGVGAPTSAVLQAGASTVTLRLAGSLAGPQAYTLTVTGVADRAGNVLASGTADFFFGEGAAPEPGDLVINEFLYDEPTAGNPGEFVELFNRTDRSFDLRDFTLNDETGPDEPVTRQAVFVAPGGYAVVVEDPDAFRSVFPDVAFVEQPSWSALNNTGDAVVLKYRGRTVDSLTYRPSWGGEDASLEREDPAGPSSVAANWSTTTDPRGGTPGAQNTQFAPDETGPQLAGARASADGRRVEVTLDEPLSPATVTPAAFSVMGPTVAAAQYDPGETTVLLTLSAPLPVGTTTVTASGLADLLGNATAASSTTVAYEGDATPPVLVRATAQSAMVVRVTFSEGVTAETGAAASTYALDNGIGAASSVEVVESADNLGGAPGVRVADVTFTEPLQEQTLYTLTARDVVDLAGNPTEATSARVFFGTADAPGPGDLVVTEILYDPAVGSEGEYLEVYNTTADRVFDLARVTLDDGDGDGDPLARQSALLLPGEYLALARNGEGFRSAFPDAPFAEAGSVISLSNSGEAVVLRAAGAVLDSVAYEPDWHRVELDDATGISLERRDPAGPSSSGSNWSSSLSERGGTPSAQNTVGIAETPVERDGGITVTSPFAPTLGEAAQITYTLAAEAALVRARIFDGGGRLVRELEPGRLSGSTATLVWDGTGDDRQRLRAGIYVVLVEAVDAEGGSTEAHKAAIVLARP